jgi:lytic murein transglycosylase
MMMQQTRSRILQRACAAVILLSALASEAIAAPACRNIGSFDRWLEDFKREAVAEGIAPRAVNAALAGVVLDQSVLKRDRGQGVFQQSFLQFAERMTGAARYQNGMRRLQSEAGLLGRIEQRTGVPPAVVVALWGLESDYGSYKGANFKVIQAVATLAYDCRRSEFFRDQLKAAVRIVERGDLRPEDMIGNWAGELGPTQFTPKGYFEAGLDMDGDGRVDMTRSVPDALASAANLLKNYGWQRGQPWLQEVRVPDRLPWEQAGLDIKHPRSQWVKWGVTAAHGRQPPADTMPASLILPMGRHGPAFLAYPNFETFTKWNSAMVYATTAAYFAARLAGAPVVGKGNAPVTVLTTEQVVALQKLLIARRFLEGEADGRLGVMSRAAVKQAQFKTGLPADSYPTTELIERLRGR